MEVKNAGDGGAAGRKEKNQNIQVFVRVRPLNSQERNKNAHKVVDTPGTREVVLTDRPGSSVTRTFSFDRVFGVNSKQADVYKVVVSPLIAEVLLGYNCTVFAYGQTGTGKTFTMEGDRTDKSSNLVETDPLAGILPRALSQLFDELRLMNGEFTVRVSFLELYNEELTDLLAPIEENKTKTLRLFEDSSRKGSVIIQGLEEVIVKNKVEVYNVLDRGSQQRKTAATLMNASSSRSHTIFTITVHMKESTVEGEELVKVGKLHLVDLAGSENIGKSGAIDKRAREAGSINQSLLTLGRVISALVERAPHIPYRESKLTRLLQDSLGGKTKTSIIATISPASVNSEETWSTLDYAHRAKNIMNRPEINQKLTKREALNMYAEEIERLRRDVIANRDKDGVWMSHANYDELTNQSKSLNHELNEKSNQIRELEETVTTRDGELEEAAKEIEELKTDIQVKDTLLADVQAQKRRLEGRLLEAERKKAELTGLVQYHERKEEEMSGEANTLLNTANDTVATIEALHSRLERKQEVEQKNIRNAERFREDFDVSVKGVLDLLNNARETHTISISNLREILLEREPIRETILSDFKEVVSKNTSKMNAMQDKLTDLNSLLMEKYKERVDEASKALDKKRNKNIKGINGSLTEVDTFLKNAQELIDSITADAEFLKDDLARHFERCTSFYQNWLDLKNSQHAKADYSIQNIVNLWNFAFNDVNEKCNEMMLAQDHFKSSINNRMQILKQEMLGLEEEAGKFLTYSNNSVQFVQGKMGQCATEMNNRERDRIETYQKLRCEEEESKKKMIHLQMDHENHLTKLTKVSELAGASKMRITEGLAQTEKTKETHEIMVKELCTVSKESMKVISADLKSATKNIQDNLSTHKNELDNFREQSSTTVTDIINSEVKCQEKVMGLLNNQCDDISTKTNLASSSICHMGGSMGEFWDNTFLIDTPSGGTPMRRMFEYPRKLTVPSPYDRVIARIRKVPFAGLPTNINESGEDSDTSVGTVVSNKSDHGSQEGEDIENLDPTPEKNVFRKPESSKNAVSGNPDDSSDGEKSRSLEEEKERPRVDSFSKSRKEKVIFETPIKGKKNEEGGNTGTSKKPPPKSANRKPPTGKGKNVLGLKQQN